MHVKSNYCFLPDVIDFLNICLRHITPKVKTRDSEVQTGLDVGLHYHWVNDSASEAWTSAQYRQAFVDPARVATSVVSAEALDGSFSYCPDVY